jgi:HAD superfamily hydrolase (TIGR01456 family)
LLTNGGGKHESERVKDLSERLSVPLDTSLFVQSHTPFSELGDREQLKQKCILVVGGDGPKCRAVAQEYGFENVVTPGDIYAAHPEIWPFSRNFGDYYSSFAKPLPRPINPASPKESLKIDAVFVYNDPRDWGLDIQLILDVLLSKQGILGTLSAMNGQPSLPNYGYGQDGQPPLYFSNPDLLWASKYNLPRLGQGAFRASLFGAWKAVTSLTNPEKEVAMNDVVIGKPYTPTYAFAERQLTRHRDELFGGKAPPLETVYMVGDNPESDIRGANSYVSEQGVKWVSILTKTGVFNGDEHTIAEASRRPKHIVQSVADAVALGIRQQHGMA